MKSRVEEYLKGKNINGEGSMFDKEGRYLIADDIHRTLSAVRVRRRGKKNLATEGVAEGGLTGENGPATKKAKTM